MWGYRLSLSFFFGVSFTDCSLLSSALYLFINLDSKTFWKVSCHIFRRKFDCVCVYVCVCVKEVNPDKVPCLSL